MAAPEFDIVSIIASAGVVTKGTLLILVVMSVATWATWGQRRLALTRLTRESRTARESFHRAGNLAEMEEQGRFLPDGPLRRLYLAAHAELTGLQRIRSRAAGPPTAAQAEAGRSLLSRTLVSVRGREMQAARRGLSLLATVGATAPFIGLFGTVWGIVDAFAGIAAAGGAGLEVVAPGVAEALVATGAGLVAAVPAVWAHNGLAHASRGLGAEFDAFAVELLNAHDRDVAGGTASAE